MDRFKTNPELAKKISHLQLNLQPLVPLPDGDPHPAFPRTLLAYHLLTEGELDDIAHYYHQSTPSKWTHHYPASMNWDKEWLNASRRRRSSLASTSRQQTRSQGYDEEQRDSSDWLAQVVNTSLGANNEAATPTVSGSRRRSSSAKPSKGLTDAERIAIKRRKVGKFIGLVGMDTPASEIEGRLREAMERVVQEGQDELRMVEEWYLRRKKLG